MSDSEAGTRAAGAEDGEEAPHTTGAHAATGRLLPGLGTHVRVPCRASEVPGGAPFVWIFAVAVAGGQPLRTGPGVS